MAKYLFGFKTHNINEVGELLYSGDGSGLMDAVEKSGGKGFARLGVLTNPILVPIAVHNSSVAKAQAETRARMEAEKAARISGSIMPIETESVEPAKEESTETSREADTVTSDSGSVKKSKWKKYQ